MVLAPDPGRPSFRSYILTRRYHHGRGSDEGWAFVALALGDPNLPDARDWRELRGYLLERGSETRIVEGARSVWSSYSSHVSRERKLSRKASTDLPPIVAQGGANAMIG
jgi:hypothetical protein